MIERYEQSEITKIWSDENKLLLWQRTELAAVKALVLRGKVESDVYGRIEQSLTSNPIDIEEWKRLDKKLRHDLNAFLDERLRFIPEELHQHFHLKLTSFDTQEPAFARMLLDSLVIVEKSCNKFEKVLEEMARTYRFTVMNARTHGQEAELMTFGARCLSWLADFRMMRSILADAIKRLNFSKMSGAHGKYGSIDPEIEKAALLVLGFSPYYGATQIMPRIIYAPVAEALADLVQLLHKFSLDIRLNARSGRPLMREPFSKTQKGSSAMPHKKNPVRLEQIEGMARLANGYEQMIRANIPTWEERAIEQSCVERIAWPDLFHVAVYSLDSMITIFSGLKVYPENMLLEIYESHDVAMSSELKEFFKKRVAKFGLKYDDAYRIVQLACFNMFAPSNELESLSEPPKSFEEAANNLIAIRKVPYYRADSIKDFMPKARLQYTDELEISTETVELYNYFLSEAFIDKSDRDEWSRHFDFSEIFKNQEFLYREILGE